MKIAVVVPSFPTISETFILNHITGLLNDGHELTVLALSENRNSKRHGIIQQYQLLQKTRYLRIPSANKTYRRIIAGFLIAIYSLRFPVCVYKVIKALKAQSFQDFYEKLYFSFLILSNPSDIYHFHFAQIARLGAFLKTAGIPIRMVTSLHGYDVNLLPRNHNSDFYRELFEEGDHFIANTEFTKQQTVKLGCIPAKISVVPVGLYVDQFPFRVRLLQPSEQIRILTVGRLVEKKGHTFSIRAVAELIRKGFSIRYTIAGDGPLREELHKLVISLGIESNVIFCGEQTQAEIIKLYENSHLFVLSSVTASNGDKEGQGLVLQEAQACGLPVVSTLHNGIPEGILDGTSGYLVPEQDIESLANAIEKLIIDPLQWEQMGNAGRNYVAAKYEIKLLIPQLCQIYRNILKTHHRDH